MLGREGLAEGEELGSNVLHCRNEAATAAEASKEASRRTPFQGLLFDPTVALKPQASPSQEPLCRQPPSYRPPRLAAPPTMLTL